LAYALKNRTILQGDVIEKLRELPHESIDCVITSPPYWGLRDYSIKGQWGLEDDFHEYLEKMRVFMDHIKKVLKPTGTVWINLGDTYAGGNAHSDWSGCTTEFMGRKKETEQFFKAQVKNHLSAKTRYGIPERFYAQCIDDDWIARNHIPWYKSNAMPSSVKDRFTNKWESIFFFVKQQKYYFNLGPVREKTITETKPFNIRVRENITGHAQSKLGDLSWIASKEELDTHNKKGERKQDNVPSKNHNLYEGFNERYLKNQASKYEKNSNAKRLGMTRNKERFYGKLEGKPNAQPEGRSHFKIGKSMHDYCKEKGIPENNPDGKNPGDVFFINPKPFPEAHFATFPIELPLKIIKCACPPDGTVLDPFFGAGTVGLAAEKLGRDWIGIELSEKYIKIAQKRLNPFGNEKIL